MSPLMVHEAGVMASITPRNSNSTGSGVSVGDGVVVGVKVLVGVGGCDVGCRWCDVKESWNPDLHPLTNVESVVQNALQQPSRAVVVTGGEPLIYNMDYLCGELKRNGVKTYLETSGAYPLSGNWDWICLSPKKNSAPVGNITEKANELKVIVFNDSDIAWAEQFANQVHDKCVLYLQPEWSRAKYMTPCNYRLCDGEPQMENLPSIT